MADLKTLDPGKYQAAFAGVVISGYATGDMITVEWDEDLAKKYVGGDGEPSRCISRHKGGTVKIRLAQTSSVNAALEAATAVDRVTGNAPAMLMVRDRSGLSSYWCDKAWLKKRPTATFGDQVGEREWVFDCGILEGITAGN